MLQEAVQMLFVIGQIAIVAAWLLHVWRNGRPKREASTITILTVSAGMVLCYYYLSKTGEIALPCAVGVLMLLTAFVTCREMRHQSRLVTG